MRWLVLVYVLSLLGCSTPESRSENREVRYLQKQLQEEKLRHAQDKARFYRDYGQEDSGIFTDGMHNRLPNGQTKTILWGDDSEVVSTATLWLQKRGLTIIERAQLQHLLQEQKLQLHYSRDEEAISVGRILGAKHIIYVSAKDYSVALRGVDLETAEIMWMGTAKYLRPIMMTPQTARALTCQALATAFGYRQPGEQDIRSEAMCMKPTQQ